MCCFLYHLIHRKKNKNHFSMTVFDEISRGVSIPLFECFEDVKLTDQ